MPASLDALLEGFELLANVADGELPPEKLRKESILGSTSMLRVLAGAYHDLGELGWDDEQITEFFTQLSPLAKGPLAGDSPWVTEVPGEVFSEGALAPKARRQDLGTLVDTLVAWAKNQPEWLSEPTPIPAAA